MTINPKHQPSQPQPQPLPTVAEAIAYLKPLESTSSGASVLLTAGKAKRAVAVIEQHIRETTEALRRARRASHAATHASLVRETVEWVLPTQRDRMILEIAARAIERGRHLSASERLSNLVDALAAHREDEGEGLCPAERVVADAKNDLPADYETNTRTNSEGDASC